MFTEINFPFLGERIERSYVFQQPPVENRLNYERKRPDFTATTPFPTSSTTSSSFVVFQLGEDVLIESTTDHHGLGKNHVQIPPTHNVINKVAKHQHARYNPPVQHHNNNQYQQQQQVPKIRLKQQQPVTTYSEPVTIVSTLPPPPPPPSPTSFNSINLNHVNTLVHETPSPDFQQQSFDSYGSPLVQQPQESAEFSQPTVYLPTSTTSNVFLEQNEPVNTYQEQVQFLAPVQPASPVFTTVTEETVYQQQPEEPTTYEAFPAAQQVVQTTDNNNNFFQPDNDLNAPNYQFPSVPVFLQQSLVPTYQEQVPIVATTSTPLPSYQESNSFSTLGQQPVVVVEQSTPTLFTSDSPTQPAADVFNLPVYQAPTTFSSSNVFLKPTYNSPPPPGVEDLKKTFLRLKNLAKRN